MGKKILLVDDETHILRAAEIKLSRSGYDVTCAQDGEQAWDLIQQTRPDILVTDLQMPRVDGFELSRRVRANPDTRDMPILVLTAKGFEMAHRDLAEAYGVVAILSKPFSPRELVRCVDNVFATGNIGSIASI
jgi:DNA-binding response OmpR family regulator